MIALLIRLTKASRSITASPPYLPSLPHDIHVKRNAAGKLLGQVVHPFGEAPRFISGLAILGA